jgi:hypothetical protein
MRQPRSSRFCCHDYGRSVTRTTSTSGHRALRRHRTSCLPLPVRGWRVATGEGALMGVAMVGTGSVLAVDYAVRRLAGILGPPPWLARLGGLLAAGWAVSTPDRRRAVGQVGAGAPAIYADEMTSISESWALLAEHAVQVPLCGSAEARVADVLITSSNSGALLAREIQDRLVTTDGTDDVPSIRALRSMFTSAPCFEEGPPLGYRLGHRYIPSARRHRTGCRRADTRLSIK